METHTVSTEELQGMGEEQKAGHQLRVSFQSPNLTFLRSFLKNTQL